MYKVYLQIVFPNIEIMEMYLVFCFDQINLSQDNAIRVHLQMISMCNIVFD